MKQQETMNFQSYAAASEYNIWREFKLTVGKQHYSSMWLWQDHKITWA